jgi:hypothetical protein
MSGVDDHKLCGASVARGSRLGRDGPRGGSRGTISAQTAGNQSGPHLTFLWNAEVN